MGRILLALTMLGMHGHALRGQAPASARVGPPPASRPHFRVGIIADAQFCDQDMMMGRYYRISLEKLHTAVDTFNAQKVDLVVNLGDLVDGRLESFPTVLREIDRLEMPVHHLLGNHEFWEVPFHSQAGVLDSLGLASGYCDLELPGWRFLLLDGTDLAAYSQGAHRELTEEAELCRDGLAGQSNAALWNGAIGESQLAWMEWHLRDAEARGERVALFCHFPITPPGHPMTLWNDAELRILLSRHPPVKAWFAGHSHTGGYRFLEGIHHLTFGGMLMTADSNSFAILDFYEDTVLVEGFGREPYRILGLDGGTPQGHTIVPKAGTVKPAFFLPQYPCIHRQVRDAMGRTVLIDDAGGNEAPSLPRLQPGCYHLLEGDGIRQRQSMRIILPDRQD
jgi:predicted phosphodiesterase